MGEFEFDSEYDPSICLLLCPDLDMCLDRFHGSICQQVRSVHFVSTDVKGKQYVWQVFRSKSRPESRFFPMVAWEAAAQKAAARLHDSPSLRAALQWHFRQCLVKNWCTAEIREKSFLETGSEEVALCIFGCDHEISIPSSDAGYISWSDLLSVGLHTLLYAH